MTSHQSLADYYTKNQVDNIASSKLNYRLFHERINIDLNNITEAWKTYEVNNRLGTANTPTDSTWHQAVQWGTGDTDYTVQLCTAYTSDYSLYLRHKIAGNWYPWHQLATINDIPTTLPANGGNADTVDGVHMDWSTNYTAGNYLAIWDNSGTVIRPIPRNDVSIGNADTVDGIHANGLLTALSNSDKGISITVGGTTKSVSNISVNYASSAGNADTVDGEHASAFTRIVGRHKINTSGTAPYNYIHLFRIANSGCYSTLDCEIDIRTRYHSAKIEIRISTAEQPYNDGGSSISIVKKVVSDRTCNLWFLPTIQSSNYNYYDVYYKSGAWNEGTYGITLKGINGTLVFEHKGTNLTSLPDKVTPVSDNIATSATKLQTPRSIWGQSFDGTGNVDGTLTAHGNILATGGITAYSSSDVRLKTNITKLNCLNVIKSIGGTYEFDYIRDHKHSIGFIAQNVNNPLLKDIVAKDDNDYLKINYWNPKLISLAFGALTEIDDEVDKLKARVRELESEVEYLKNKDYALQ